MRSYSLPTRLAATSLLVATVTSALLVIGVQVLLARTNDVTIHTRLIDRANAADATVRVTASGATVVTPRSTLVEQNSWVFGPSGQLLSGRLSAENDDLSDAVHLLSTSTERRYLSAHDELALLAEPVIRDGHRIATVVVSEDLRPYEGSELHSLYLTLGLAATAVALATLAAWAAASRSLRPVRAMAATADEWREHDLGARFDLGTGTDEISQLGRTLDKMLDRIAEALSAERRLTDEIAHELRTPLTVVLAESDLAVRDPTGDHREAWQATHDSAVRMRSAIDSMLAVARAHADQHQTSRLGDLVAELGFPPTDLDELLLAAPTALLAAAIRPLLENAELHGGGPARLEVEQVGRGLRLSVVDDGPGVPVDRLDCIFEPGRSTRADGAGLGLALSRRVTNAVGVKLVAKPGPGGRFELLIALH